MMILPSTGVYQIFPFLCASSFESVFTNEQASIGVMAYTILSQSAAFMRCAQQRTYYDRFGSMNEIGNRERPENDGAILERDEKS